MGGTLQKEASSQKPHAGMKVSRRMGMVPWLAEVGLSVSNF